jgi:predicted dehydrogenase
MATPARILIAGMGSIGLRHARICAAEPETIVEVCESRPEGLAETRAQMPQVKSWTDYHTALEAKPDYVIIATPHQAHADMSIAALEKGIPVLCEKPMSHSLADAEKMMAASRRHRTPLAVGYCLRFHPGVQRLRKMLADGEIGSAFFARYCVDSLIALQNSRSRYQATLPGALFMDYSHGLDLLFHLMGKLPATVVSRGIVGNLGDFKADPILFSAIFGYEKNLQAELHFSYALKPEIHTLQVIGERLGVLIELNSGRVDIQDIAKSAQQTIDLPYERDPLYVQQWRAFRNFCLGQASDVCTGDEALKTNQLMDRLLSSWLKDQ